MEKIVNKVINMEKRKLGKILFAIGMLLLVVSSLLMVLTESIFGIVFLVFSVIFNTAGLYIILWVKDRGDNGDKR